MGIHRTYPDQMKEYWNEFSSKVYVSQSTIGGCEDRFRYEDDGTCPGTSWALDDNKIPACVCSLARALPLERRKRREQTSQP